ncbi:ABC transporter ATP-binding protein [Virgibacillus dakarensis]|nr:ABC transporter ATP-binding protein [Virgibacillus dakarensis]
MTILHAESVSHSFSQKQVLSEIELKVDKGRTYTIIGPNGSGKSTLLHMIARQLKPDQGGVYLNGKDLYRLSPKKAAREIALLAQDNGTADLTVSQLVAYGRTPHKPMFGRIDEEDEMLIDEVMRRTKLGHLKDRNVAQLSGGERQRVWFALALAQQPIILFLDEPTTYLDIFHQLDVLEIVSELRANREVTVVMVLHDLNHAAAYSDEVVVLQNGRIYRQGPPEVVMDQQMFKDVFHVGADIYKNEQSNVVRFVIKPL